VADPIRLLITSFDYRPRLGGVATCAFELSRALASQPGVEIRVLAPAAPGDAEFDHHGRFTTLRSKLPGSATAAILPMALWIAREVRSWRPDAVLNLLWHPCGVATVMGLALVTKPPPFFVLAHGVELIESRRNLKKRLRANLSFAKRLVFHRARAALAVSRFTSEILVTQCGVPRSKTSVVYNGVNPDEFFNGPRSVDLVRSLGLEGRKVLLTVTRLDEYKGVDRAISALRYVVARRPDVTYLVCGDGKDRRRLEALVGHFGLREHVIFAGLVPADRLREFYNLADCFILVSREDWLAPDFEGFGIVFLEAAACEKPCIGGRSGGIPDAVVEGETGWLVDPQNEYEISRAMLECLEDPSAAVSRGQAGRARVIREFTWGHMAQRVLAQVTKHVRH
jgi:phosphatidylinositol alpha-1,6-mannosyltransferase